MNKSINDNYLKYIKVERHGPYGSKYYDSRLNVIDKVPHVYPAGFNSSQVIIICPYCHRLHYHGLCDGDYEGPRVAHCTDKEAQRINNKGYYIETV